MRDAPLDWLKKHFMPNPSGQGKRRGNSPFEQVQRVGKVTTINSQSIRVYDRDENGNVLFCSGLAFPTDAGAGYAKGCLFIDTDVGAGTSGLYKNDGTTASCDFNLIEGVEAVVTGVTAGNGLTGGGTEGAVTINVGAGLGMAVNADDVAVAPGRGVAVRTGATDVGVNIYNNTGGDLLLGTLVNLSGFSGTSGITVTKADADAGIRATHVILDVIANLAAGVAYPVGRATAQNTNGRTIGDLVYMDATTAGAYTFSAPTGADQMVQIVGVVKVVNASTGEIEFFPGSGHVTKFGTSQYQDGSITPAKQSTAARTRVAIVPFKLPAPTGSNQGPFSIATFVQSQAWTLVSLKVGSDIASSGSDGTNQYQFQGRNLTGAADLHTVVTTTQGAELSATVPKTITVSQNLGFTANQVFGLKVDIADDGSAGPTDLSGAQLYAILEYTI